MTNYNEPYKCPKTEEYERIVKNFDYLDIEIDRLKDEKLQLQQKENTK